MLDALILFQTRLAGQGRKRKLDQIGSFMAPKKGGDWRCRSARAQAERVRLG